MMKMMMMMMMMMYVALDVMVFSIDLASISHYRRSCPIVQEDRAILYLCIHSAESYFRLFSTGVVTVRDEYLLFVKVILMMSIRVMRASADVTHSLAVAGAVLNTNLVCRRAMFSAIILTTSFASVFTTQQPSRC